MNKDNIDSLLFSTDNPYEDGPLKQKLSDNQEYINILFSLHAAQSKVENLRCEEQQLLETIEFLDKQKDILYNEVKSKHKIDSERQRLQEIFDSLIG